jgi:signal transduction histidine kinase
MGFSFVSKWIFPIRYKIVLMLSAVLMAAVAFYLYLAARIFEEDKTLLVYELNETNVRTLSAELDAYFGRMVEKLKVYSFMAEAARSVESIDSALKTIFNQESELLRVALFTRTNSNELSFVTGRQWQQIDQLTDIENLYKSSLLELKHGEVWVKNVSYKADDGIHSAYALALAFQDGDGVSRLVFAVARLDGLLQSFPKYGVATTFAVDSEGYVLAHSNADELITKEKLWADPVIDRARQSIVRTGVVEYDTVDSHAKPSEKVSSASPWFNFRWNTATGMVGAYSKASVGQLIVASRIERKEAFAAARVLIQKSILYAAIVVTIAFLISLFFSHSLTEPMSRMIEATRRIAEGDFSKLLRVTTHDELALLAHSFNTMTVHLKSSREEILEANRTLEGKVKDRTAKLAEQNAAIKEAQEALVRTTRLASVGEIAGRAAHEVLNPLTNITARLEKIEKYQTATAKNDLRLLEEIFEAWDKDYAEKGAQGLWQSLQKQSTVDPQKTLLDEDLGNIQSILKDQRRSQDQLQEDIRFLIKEAARISKIVNNMRTLTRVSGDKKVILLHQFLQDVAATTTDLLAKYNIRLDVAPQATNASGNAGRAVAIRADQDELMQVFTNLIRNSMQAIDEARRVGAPVGEPALIWLDYMVESATGDASTAVVQIRVGDNGPGIAPENQARLFESSFTTKNANEGTGLGLSIARRFIRAYQGEIILEESKPAQSTVFLITLPAEWV